MGTKRPTKATPRKAPAKPVLTTNPTAVIQQPVMEGIIVPTQQGMARVGLCPRLAPVAPGNHPIYCVLPDGHDGLHAVTIQWGIAG